MFAEVEGAVVELDARACRDRQCRLGVGDQPGAFDAAAVEGSFDRVERRRLQRTTHQRLELAALDAAERHHEVECCRLLATGAPSPRAPRASR